MKILWIYKYDHTYDFDCWLHLKYVEYLQSYSGIEIVAWGPRIQEHYKHLAPFTYSPTMTIEELYKNFKFDVIILNTKSRMFEYYMPKEPKKNVCWLPQDFSTFNKVPKIMIEEDYHYETSDAWYEEVGISLILHRHYGNIQRKRTIKTAWLPFSVDTGIFYPEPTITRSREIAFVGSVSETPYLYRYTALQRLLPSRLIIDKNHPRLYGDAYIKCLQKYRAHLSGCSTYNITPGKMFEIMASGSILFTNRDSQYGLKELFPDGSYMTYANNGSDVVVQAKQLLENAAFAETIAAKGLQVIQERHNHGVRTNQLLEFIKEEIKNGK